MNKIITARQIRMGDTLHTWSTPIVVDTVSIRWGSREVIVNDNLLAGYLDDPIEITRGE